jgi:integrase
MPDPKDSLSARLKAAKTGAFTTVCKVAPQGALQARKLASGAVMLYWRFTHEGTTERVQIGPYDAALPPKSLDPKAGAYSILAATRAAEAKAKLHLANLKDGGHRAVVEAEREQRAKVKAEAVEAGKHTLRALLDAYTKRLEDLGRQAHGDATSIFKLHVYEAWPELADKPASRLDEEQVADMLRRLHDADKGRTANKLRAYLRAAYETARRARTDPAVPVAFKRFNIRANPVAVTATASGANKADKRPLSAKDMRVYWQAIEALPGFKGAVLRLHLLTGAQRIAQLVRLKTTDIGEGVITLHDGKGRPGKGARQHAVPLVAAAANALKALQDTPYTRRNADEQAGEFAITTDRGHTHLSPMALSQWACEVAEAAGIAEFEAKRLRSGVETLLAAAGIDRDTRGRLQSHGITGVQATHYDDHDYLPEKLRALEVLQRRLTAPDAANVVELHAA